MPIFHQLIKHATEAIWIMDLLILLEYCAKAEMDPFARARSFVFFECPF
jgi:hypothetical protein